jgi:hypothetical protein
LSQIVIPSEVEEIVSKTFRSEDSIELPQYVRSFYDPSSRAAQVIFSFTNPFEFDLTLNSVFSNIVCLDHDFALGTASLNNPVSFKSDQTQEIAIDFFWSLVAENHFVDLHSNESTVDVKLVDITLDISGISIQMPKKCILRYQLNED